MGRVSASEMTASDLAALAHQADGHDEVFTYKPDLDQISTPYDGEMHLEEAAVAGEGCTFGDVAKMFLRVTAGVVGLPLYGLMLASTALLSVCLIGSGVILGLPFALIGGCIGAAFVASEGAYSGDVQGATYGLIIGGLPFFLAEGVSYLPKAILCFTVGIISAGLTSYALYGTLELNDSETEAVGYPDLKKLLMETNFYLAFLCLSETSEKQ